MIFSGQRNLSTTTAGELFSVETIPVFKPRAGSLPQDVRKIIDDLNRYDAYFTNRPLTIEIVLLPKKFELLKQFSQTEIGNKMIYENRETGRKMIVKTNKYEKKKEPTSSS